MIVWGEFVLCVALILVSGSLLVRYGDLLAVRTGMGRTWVGLVLLATVTSLPELATGLSSVTVAAAPDLAVGDVLGSCIFNLMLIGLIDLFYPAGPILSKVEEGHSLAAGFGVLLIGIAAWGLVWGAHGPHGSMMPEYAIGLSTWVILPLYGVAMRMVFQFERKRMSQFVQAEARAFHAGDLSTRQIYSNVALHAGVIIVAGVWLPFVGTRIAETTGWGMTFIGNVLIAASTSLPEIVVSFAALRLAAPDLAIANLFGSNLFNIAVLGVDDLAYRRGPLLSHVSIYHLFSAITALMMTGICIAGLIYRADRKAWGVLGWDGIALLALYFLNAYLLFLVAKGAMSA
jgi:cation:H+ antiporter